MKRKLSPARLGKGLAALGLALILAGCSAGAVTQTQATEIALDHAGVTQEDLLSLSVKLEQEGGRQVFDIQFTTDDREYQYDVTSNSGEIVNYSYQPTGQTSQEEPQAEASQSQESQGTSSQASQQESSQSQSQGITQEEAQAIALNHAGVTLEEATIYKVKADVENGRSVYDVEFAVGATEYDYEIAQDTGEILSYDADVEGKKARFKEAGMEYTVKQIDAYRSLGINGIHLYALNKWKDVSEIVRRAGMRTIV